MAMPVADIEAYFAKVETGAYSGLLRLELNLLDRMAADSSNYHVLLRRHPFEGHVLYLVHDDASRIVFASLAGLIEAANRAKAGGLALPDLHPRWTKGPYPAWCMASRSWPRILIASWRRPWPIGSPAARRAP